MALIEIAEDPEIDGLEGPDPLPYDIDTALKILYPVRLGYDADGQKLDIEHDDCVYVWLRLEWDGGLSIEYPPDVRSVGMRPGWLDAELDCMSWGDILDIKSHLDNDYTFARENGVAPYQPFLLRMGRPDYFQSGWECVEWDVEYDWEIVTIEEWEPTLVAQAWQRLTEETDETIPAPS